jgi:hypothetical protein
MSNSDILDYTPWEDYISPQEYTGSNWLGQEYARQKRLGVRTGMVLRYIPSKNPSEGQMVDVAAFEERVE